MLISPSVGSFLLYVISARSCCLGEVGCNGMGGSKIVVDEFGEVVSGVLGESTVGVAVEMLGVVIEVVGGEIGWGVSEVAE